MLSKKTANVGEGVVASTYNKDVLKVQLVIDGTDEIIEEVNYKFFGSSEMHDDLEFLSNILVGMSIRNIGDIDTSSISKNVQRSTLIIGAINAAIINYMAKEAD